MKGPRIVPNLPYMSSACSRRLAVSDDPPYDALQAFVRDNHVALRGAQSGPLDDLVFAIKDVWQVEGSRVGNGHPAYLSDQAPSDSTASIVTRLLDSGADLVGKTICDELCYSISGENWHYGSPINPLDPSRYVGGSSSGSAAATAGGLVDFALGSDCLGSVRMPCSYTGLLGMRPTYKRVPDDGEASFCPSMDVVGFMAEHPDVFDRVAQVLLGNDENDAAITDVRVAVDCLDVVDASVADEFAPAAERLIDLVGSSEDVRVAPDGLDMWVEIFRTIQGYEVWHSYAPWIRRARPRLTPGPRERLEWASTITAQQYTEAKAARDKIMSGFDSVVQPGTVLALPTAASIAPLRSAGAEQITATRQKSSLLLCISPLCGAPQVTVPIMPHHGAPLGLTLIGAPGTDRRLARLAADLATSASYEDSRS